MIDQIHIRAGIRTVACAAVLWAGATAAAPTRQPEEAPQPLAPAGARADPAEDGALPAEPPADAADVAAREPDGAALPVYVPPQRGAPATRVGGGTRTVTGDAPQVRLLSPEHTGLTTAPAPTLYWYLSRDHAGPFELVVTDRHAVQPALRTRLTDLAAGIHALRLEDYGITLAPGRHYQWSVSLVRDETHRARDIVAVAAIERIERAAAGPGAAALAAAGLWYDAIEAVSDPRLPEARAALLEQVGLADAAAWERSRSCRAPVTASC